MKLPGVICLSCPIPNRNSYLAPRVMNLGFVKAIR